MAISCTCCEQTIVGKSNKLIGWQAKWFSGKDKNFLCDDCYKDFKRSALREGVAIMIGKVFQWIYFPDTYKKLMAQTVCATCHRRRCICKPMDFVKRKRKREGN